MVSENISRRIHNFKRQKIETITWATKIEHKNNAIFYYGDKLYNHSSYKDRLLVIDVIKENGAIYRIYNQSPLLNSPIEKLEVYNIDGELTDTYNYIHHEHCIYPENDYRRRIELNPSDHNLLHNLLNP